MRMQAKPEKQFALKLLVFAACSALCIAAGAAMAWAAGSAAVPLAPHAFAAMKAAPPIVLAQNPATPFILPQQAEAPISPINPGTLPGSTAAIGGSATGTNPITGLPCNGAGSLAVSGAGGLPGTATPPPQDSTETLGQIPVGTPPTTSVFGSQSNLGSC